MDTNQNRSFDRSKAEFLMGKYILICINYFTPAMKMEGVKQLHGIVAGFDPAHGLKIELKGASNGKIYWLPPITQSFDPADPGKYKLDITDEVIENPDFIAVINMVKKTPDSGGTVAP